MTTDTERLIIRTKEKSLAKGVLKSLKQIFLEFPGDDGVDMIIEEESGSVKHLELRSIKVDAEEAELIWLIWELLHPEEIEEYPF